MYPYVDNRGLHCGFDDSTNLSITKTMAGMIPIYSIVCNDHRKSGNQVCGLNALLNLIGAYASQNNLSKSQIFDIIDVVCRQLSTTEIKLTFNKETNGWEPI